MTTGKHPSPLRVLLIAAAVLIGIVFVFMGQLFFAGALLIAALIVGVASLFARAKTPTD
jgi:hypothetical protein